MLQKLFEIVFICLRPMWAPSVVEEKSYKERMKRGDDLPANIPNSRADENIINIVPISFDFVACQELLDSFAPNPSYEQECGLRCCHVSLTSNKENLTSIP